eukprot:13145719-Alexandrium_andersonii.AAC.1
MSASLVGSEMCIRDSSLTVAATLSCTVRSVWIGWHLGVTHGRGAVIAGGAVSCPPMSQLCAVALACCILCTLAPQA